MKALLWAAWFTWCSHHYVIVTLLQYGMKALLWAAWFTWWSTSLCHCYFVTVRYGGFTVGSLVHLMFTSICHCYFVTVRYEGFTVGSLVHLMFTSLCHWYFVTVRYEGFTVGSLVHLMFYIIMSLLLFMLQYGIKALLCAAWFTWWSTSLCHCYFVTVRYKGFTVCSLVHLMVYIIMSLLLCYSSVWRLYCGQPGSLNVLHHYVIVTLLQYGMKALLWAAWFTWWSTSLCHCYFSCYSTVWRLYCGQPGSLDGLHHYVIVTLLQYGMKPLLWTDWFTWWSTALCHCYFVTVRYEGFTVGSLVRSQGRR